MHFSIYFIIILEKKTHHYILSFQCVMDYLVHCFCAIFTWPISISVIFFHSEFRQKVQKHPLDIKESNFPLQWCSSWIFSNVHSGGRTIQIQTCRLFVQICLCVCLIYVCDTNRHSITITHTKLLHSVLPLVLAMSHLLDLIIGTQFI